MLALLSFLLFFALLVIVTHYSPDKMFLEKTIIHKPIEMLPSVKVEVVELPMFSKN